MIRKLIARVGGLLALLALVQVAAPELPIAGIAGVQSVAAQTISYPTVSSAKPRLAPKVIACIGDSIAVRDCGTATGSAPLTKHTLTANSLWFQAMYGPGGTPRDVLFYGFAVSGSRSGNESGYTAVDGTDMNTPAIMAKLDAVNPDVLWIITGGNNAANTTDTYNNVLAVVQREIAKNPNMRIVLSTSPPQIRGSTGVATFLTQLRAQYDGIARTYPNNVMVFARELYTIDDQTQHCPKGVNGTCGTSTTTLNTAIAGTQDAQHPSVWAAMNMAASANRMADDLGLPTARLRACYKGDRYSSSLTGGNLIGGVCNMNGSNVSGALGGGTTSQDDVTGSLTLSWAVTGGGELSAVTAVGGSVSYQGNTFRSVTATVTATTLTAARTLTASRQAVNSMVNAKPLHCSALVNIASGVAVEGIKFNVAATVNGDNTAAFSVGGPETDVAQNYLPSGLYALMLPFYIVPDAGTSPTLSVQITYGTGASGALGTVDVAQMNCYPEV